MKRGPEFYSAVADALCENASYASAARKVGCDVSTIFRALAHSHQHPEEKFEYGSYGALTFTEAVTLAKRINGEIRAGNFLDRVDNGRDEIVIFDGQVQYARDLRIPPDWTPDEMEICYGVRDPWLRDDEGKLVPLTRKVYPSDAAAITALRVTAGDAWKDEKNVHITHGGGVHIVSNKPAKPAQLSAPDQEIVEQAVQAAIAAEPQTFQSFETLPPDLDADTEDTQYLPIPAGVLNVHADDQPDEPVEFIETPPGHDAVAASNPPQAKPDLASDRAKAARARLEALAKIPPKNPNPTAPIQKFGPGDN